ncbi:MAG: hypothetical protein ACO34E_14930 [Limisphaerales bacterium]
MRDPVEPVFGASRDRLARLLRVGEGDDEQWRPDELRAILAHQLEAPLVADLSGQGGEGIRTFGELFGHVRPPVGLLRQIKEYAKVHREHPLSALPSEVTTVLYYTSIVVARLRLGESITALEDSAVRLGVEWVLGQGWVTDELRELMIEAQRTFTGELF